MAGRGRPRKPKNIKELRGTIDKRWASEKEPKFPMIIDKQAPEMLTPGAKAIWDQVAPELVELGMIQTVDIMQLASYCSLMDIYHRALDDVNSLGWESDTGKRTSPSAIVLFKAHEAAMKVASKFGFTPSDRARLDIKPPDKQGDIFDSV